MASETSLKAFSHQRRVKPFNTLRSKSFWTCQNHFLWKSHFWQKTISGQKETSLFSSDWMPFLSNSHFWPKRNQFVQFLLDAISAWKTFWPKSHVWPKAISTHSIIVTHWCISKQYRPVKIYWKTNNFYTISIMNKYPEDTILILPWMQKLNMIFFCHQTKT